MAPFTYEAVLNVHEPPILTGQQQKNKENRHGQTNWKGPYK
jgi:hypothetical protein